ncbi:hypothetical protein WNY37_18465 [Henriciella sp. AS95]|uniref:hypothetical protein n=1 Tax=Henriciella sp. AS95 TaxID=3135782 RepID=UPI00317B0625
MIKTNLRGLNALMITQYFRRTQIVADQSDMFDGNGPSNHSDQDVGLYEEKHLARNIPEQFSVVCDRIRLKEIEPNNRQRRRTDKPIKIYSDMLKQLSNEAIDRDDEIAIEEAIDEVLVRFLALQKTVDMTVPAKSVFSTISAVERSLNSAIRNLNDPDRDAAVTETSTDQPEDHSPSAKDIWMSKSLAAKVTATRQYLIETHREILELKRFFNYKSGLVKAGRPSTYSMLFAVHALAEIFEARNTKGLDAQVSQVVDGGRQDQKGRNHNQYRYEGAFLSFVTSFYMKVVPEQINRGNEGFPDQVRKFARLRLEDPDAHKLLYADNASHFQFLEFMKRADAMK